MMDIRKLDDKLTSTFRKVLVTGIVMLFVALIGGVIAFFISYNIGHAIAFIGVAGGNICIVIGFFLIISGNHLKKE